MATTFKPSQTLYVKNVNDKIHKQELRKSLYHLFSQHGRVIDVVVVKRQDMRGQAFVIFLQTASATAALRALQGFSIFGKSMKLEFAKTKSRAIGFVEGRYDPPVRQNAVATTNTENPEEDQMDEQEVDAAEKAEAGDDNDDMDMGDDMEEGSEEEDDEDAPAKVAPNKILFLTQLPASMTKSPAALTALFKQYLGFKEVRLVPGKAELAFVEYLSANQASEAMTRLQGFDIHGGSKLKIQFSKS